MVQYIDKDALVAEIERRINTLKEVVAELGNHESHECGALHEIYLYQDIRSFINTLEVKEVNLEQAYKSYMKSRKDDISGNAVTVNMKDLARHFFELGLKAPKGK